MDVARVTVKGCMNVTTLTDCNQVLDIVCGLLFPVNAMLINNQLTIEFCFCFYWLVRKGTKN